MKNINTYLSYIPKDKWIKAIIFIVLISCILLIGYTTIFYKVEYVVDGSSEAWWYEPCFGIAEKKLRPVILTTLVLLINVLPFIQWKGPSMRLPIYNFHTKWLYKLYAPVSAFHWISYLLILPYCIYNEFSPFEVTASPYAHASLMYGYHKDLNVLIFLLFFSGIIWIITHEIIWRIRCRKRIK